jgi:flagellar biogenesis protein FliO
LGMRVMRMWVVGRRLVEMRIMKLGAGLRKRVLRLSRRTPKSLRLCESLPLGERRFVAVVEFERARLLVGGTPSSVVLLSRLEDSQEGADGAAEMLEELTKPETKTARSQPC